MKKDAEKIDDKFLRLDIDTYKPRFKLVCPEIRFEIKTDILNGN